MPAEFDEERDLLARVLATWVRGATQSIADHQLGVLTDALPPATDWTINVKLKKAALPVDLTYNSGGLLIGPAVKEGGVFRPAASVHLKSEDGRLCVCIRVATYHLDRSGQLAADGYRFESGEVKKDAPHPWCHVQRMTRWHKEDESLLAPLEVGDAVVEPAQTTGSVCQHVVNEERPVFPLGCHTAAGLALAMVGSLHGVQAIGVILDQDANLRSGLDERDRLFLLPS